MNNETYFQEDQRFVQYWGWLLALVLVPVVVSWWAFVQQILLGQQFGNNPGPDWMVWAMFVLFGICFPITLYLLRMRTIVDHRAVTISFVPFFSRLIPMERVQTAKVCSYHPIREYGGWGIRWAWGRGWAYSVAGNQGVKLELAGGKSLLLGSHDPERLALAIQAAKSARR